MFASAKGKQQKYVRQLQRQEQCIDHIPFYLSGLSRAHFSDNLSRNSCIRRRELQLMETAAHRYTPTFLGAILVSCKVEFP